MFADDTQLYIAIDTACLFQLTACADAATRWFIQNDLLLSLSKTEAIITGTRQQIAKKFDINPVASSYLDIPCSSLRNYAFSESP